MQQNGVAVRIRLGDHGRTDRPSAARLVLDDEWLAELSRNLVKHDARDSVVGVPRGERADDLHRPGRPSLAFSRRRCGHECDTGDGAAQATTCRELNHAGMAGSTAGPCHDMLFMRYDLMRTQERGS